MTANTRHGLGRGLGALIPPTALSAVSSLAGVQQIEITLIEPNPRQPRRHFPDASLEELAASIREHGLIQPLLVTPVPNGPQPRYQLIAGERRWRAAQRAELRVVPAIVKGATPQQMLELALVENIQRADLNALEEAEAYRQLTEEFELTQEQVAQKVGKDRTTVSNALRLLKLPDALKQAVNDEQLSEGHARALLQLHDEKKQVALLKKVTAQGLSVRQTEELVRRAQTPLSGTRKRNGHGTLRGAARHPSPESHSIEEELRRALGTKVELYRSQRGGRIVIEFYSEEELDSIYHKIVT